MNQPSSKTETVAKEGIVLDREGQPLGAATRKVGVVWGGYRKMGLMSRILVAPMFMVVIASLLAISTVVFFFLGLGYLQRKFFRKD
ncbi:MAG: hypothetical protein EOP09_08435 [Proteobacteria bacterium]|nr:MAG: hypothetical protein EOP09_08435 [Pseudomonadota bacterium]